MIYYCNYIYLNIKGRTRRARRWEKYFFTSTLQSYPVQRRYINEVMAIYYQNLHKLHISLQYSIRINLYLYRVAILHIMPTYDLQNSSPYREPWAALILMIRNKNLVLSCQVNIICRHSVLSTDSVLQFCLAAVFFYRMKQTFYFIARIFKPRIQPFLFTHENV